MSKGTKHTGSPFGELVGASACDHGLCESCGTPVVFLLKCGEQDVPVDLLTILKCLKFASDQGNIPPVPEKWWLQIRCAFGDMIQW